MPALLRILFLLLLAWTPGALAAEPVTPGGALTLLRQLDEGFVQVFEKVAPCVVVIKADKKIDPEDREDLRGLEDFLQDAKEPRGEPEERAWRLPSRRSEGSGFLIRADGYVLTNHHVVADAEKITVRLRDAREFPGKVVGYDETTDVAIVRIEARDLPVAEIGDSERLRVGQLVCAIGAPFNQHFSFSVGWVSGKGRGNLLAPSSAHILFEDYIQTDTFINPGNSGGPLFDVEGRVIGMNTLINGLGRGLAFAVPSSMFQEVAQQIIKQGRMQWARLGVRLDTLGDEHRKQLAGIDKGVIIETIEPNTPAYQSELRPTDVITEIDGVRVASSRDLQKEILKKKVGVSVQLTVWRAGQTLRIPVVTGEVRSELTPVANLRPGKLGVEPRADTLGLKLRDAKPSGAAVVSIAPGSPAARAGMQSQDVVTEVDGQAVRDAAACAAAIGDRVRTTGDKPMSLRVERKGKRTSVVIAPELGVR